MTLRIRPKSDFLSHASWKSLHSLTTHWQSDHSYYDNEIKFLKNLIDKYYIWLIKGDNLPFLEQILDKLNVLEKNLEIISIATDEHKRHIESILNKTYTGDETDFRNEHESLEDNFAAFVNNFRILKQELFKATKLLLKEEKMNQN